MPARRRGHARAGRADAEITFLARAALSAPLRGVIFDLRTYVSRWAVHYAVVTVRVDFLRRTDVDFPLWAALHAELGLERSGSPSCAINFNFPSFHSHESSIIPAQTAASTETYHKYSLVRKFG
jgi:hypothetical protein